ncbi:MFS transporter [Pseudomonas canadensis]|uniref:MFS transporter n=1 Tax=Pseudomonas canadensis TaxID=915099 RepID=A0ABZ0ZY60_9PSED|nr:MFS transporter [Pseudomonas canadensis]WRI21890.1 MFS transporter [Pseudomonas canadensis]
MNGSASISLEKPGISTWLTLLLATACGLLAANIYYAQPLAGPIASAVGLPASSTGLIVTLTQLGYGAGLLLVAPLGDLFENRKLTITLILIAASGLLVSGLSHSPLPFLLAALVTGLGTVAVQVLVPYAAHMAPEESRGRVVGNVMSGLMLGIMLARPVASFITQLSDWTSVFYFAAAGMVLLALLLSVVLPKREPAAKMSYASLIGSMWHLLRTTPVLRRRAIYHACLFGAFSLFWTTTPLLLTLVFHLNQGEIGLFALAGVAGAIAAPIAGRVADRGRTKSATAAAMICVAAAFLITHIAPQGSSTALVLLVISAVVLDFGVSANMTLGQRTIFALGSEFRARLNGLYMTTFFMGAAAGSAVGGWAFAEGGWSLASWLGFALPVTALLYFITE